MTAIIDKINVNLSLSSLFLVVAESNDSGTARFPGASRARGWHCGNERVSLAARSDFIVREMLTEIWKLLTLRGFFETRGTVLVAELPVDRLIKRRKGNFALDVNLSFATLYSKYDRCVSSRCRYSKG